MDYDIVRDTSEKAIEVNLYADEISRPKYGYELLDCVPQIPESFENQFYTIDPADSILEPCIVETHSTRRTQAAPPTDSLFLEKFAECDTAGKCLEFALMYGRLTDNQVLLPDPTLEMVFAEPNKPRYSIVDGEPLSLWEKERRRLWSALSIWKAYLSNDVNFLQQHISFAEEPDERTHFQQYCDKQQSLIDNGKIEKCTPLEDYKNLSHLPIRRVRFNGNIIISADDKHTAFYLNHIRDEHKEKDAARILVYQIIMQALDEYPAKSNLRMDSNGEVKIKIVSNTILPKIWLQFAEMLAGSRYVRICPRCKKMFEVKKSTDKRIWHDKCGNPKHQADSRARKQAEEVKTAMDEMKAGKSLEEVAKNRGRRTSTLRRWIQNVKGESQL